MDSSFKFLLVYCKNGQVVNNIYETLIETNTFQSFEIVLDDFNIKALEQTSKVLQVLFRYVQVVTKSTCQVH